jgi:hypothetical protein
VIAKAHARRENGYTAIGWHNARSLDDNQMRHLLLVLHCWRMTKRPKALQAVQGLRQRVAGGPDLILLWPLARRTKSSKANNKAIQERVSAKVRSATRDALSAWEKLMSCCA